MTAREKILTEILKAIEVWMSNDCVISKETIRREISEGFERADAVKAGNLEGFEKEYDAMVEDGALIKAGPSEKDKKWMETLGRLVNRNMRGPDRWSRDVIVTRWAYDELKKYMGIE